MRNVQCDHCTATRLGEWAPKSVTRLHKLTVASRMGRNFADLKHNWNKKTTGQKSTIARKVLHNEVLDAGTIPSDSSADEIDVREASAVPVPDVEVLYCYDAADGHLQCYDRSGKGMDILSHAVTKAVQRYEKTVTEKLAKEYDIVDGKDFTEGYSADEDDDDFELIEHASM